MKKYFIILLSCLLLLININIIHSDDNYILLGENERDLLSNDEVETLNKDLIHISDNYNINIYFVYDSNVDNDYIVDYCDKFVNDKYNGNNTVLLFLNNEYYYIAALGDQSDLIINNEDLIFNQFANSRKESYFNGIVTYYQKVVELINSNIYETKVEIVEGTPFVVDYADLLTTEEENELINQFKNIYSKHGVYVVALTVNTLNGMSSMNYADDFYDYNNYPKNGILLLISMEDRDYWISGSGNVITTISDYQLNQIDNKVVNKLSSGDYYEAYEILGNEVSKIYTAYENGENSDDYYRKTDSNYLLKVALISLGISLFITVIVMLILRGQLKSVHKQYFAGNYVVNNSFRMIGYSDHFLHKNVTKTAKPKDNDGSSMGGGSSFHTSSSGSSHSGTGGKF